MRKPVKTVRAVTCGWCGTVFYTHDRRYKYCSEECYKASHREQCKGRFRVRYVEKYEEELERYRRYHAKNREARNARMVEWRRKQKESVEK